MKKQVVRKKSESSGLSQLEKGLQKKFNKNLEGTEQTIVITKAKKVKTENGEVIVWDGKLKVPISQLEYWTNENEYELSADHPHRQLILDVLAQEPFVGLLEVGCNTGQNLYCIQEVYPETQLAGVDVNMRAIEFAKTYLPKPIFKVGEATKLPFEDKSFDIVLYDAILMYVEDINKALDEAIRIARKKIIIVDWESKKEKLIGHSLARDYEKLLLDKGLKVEKIKILKELWPTSEKWQKYGYLWKGVI